MDVEGAEFEIVQELSSSGKMKKIREFIIEYHHNLPREMSNLSEFLNMRGMTIKYVFIFLKLNRFKI